MTRLTCLTCVCRSEILLALLADRSDRANLPCFHLTLETIKRERGAQVRKADSDPFDLSNLSLQVRAPQTQVKLTCLLNPLSKHCGCGDTTADQSGAP